MGAHWGVVRRRAGVSGLVVAVIGVAFTATPSSAAEAPADLRVVATSSTGVALAWEPTDPGYYRVRYAPAADMSGSRTWDLKGSYFELKRTDANPSHTAPALAPGAVYWVQVKSVANGTTAAKRTSLSSYSQPVRVEVPASEFSALPPHGLRATTGDADTVHLSWGTAGGGSRYAVRYTDDPSQPVDQWDEVRWDGPGGSIDDLDASTEYTFRARVVDAAGVPRSELSNPVAARTAASDDTLALNVISYNVMKSTVSKPSWTSRRAASAAAIRSQAPDVMALQEASTSTSWSKGKKSQVDDLLDLVGSKYALASRKSFGGTALAYDSSRLTAEASGGSVLTPTKKKIPRYAVWARLRDKATGTRFFAVTTHLEPTSSGSNSVRVKQARKLVALVQKESSGLPVVLAGDLNSSRASSPSNGPYRVITGAGYVDPVRNQEPTLLAGHDLPAEHTVNLEYNSANKLLSRPTRTAWTVGTHIDYVFVSPDVRVATWRMVLDLADDGSFATPAPSDHNMISTTVYVD